MADQNRDGIDDDIDRRPGNSSDSESYGRIYDPRSEREYTNLLEIENRIERRRLADLAIRNRRSAQEILRAARSDVHYFPDIGKFIIPEANNWAAHAQIVLDNGSDLFFNPEKYKHFDKIIADRLKITALTDRNHPDFAKYRGLRTNLEVLRNDIIGQYLDDGAFNPGDEVYIPKIEAIATAIGDALANDVWWKRPFVKFFSKDVANVEAVGAAELYKFLLREQDKTQRGANYLKGTRELVGLTDRNWGLLDLKETPFSPEALAAPLTTVIVPAIENNSAVVDLLPEERVMYADESRKLVQTCCGFEHVDTLKIPTKEEAVEKGRTILRWLRNLEFGDRDVQEWLSSGTPAEQIAKADALSRLITLYAGQMVLARQQSPELLTLPETKNGSDAAGGAALMIAEHALSLLPPQSESYRQLETAIESMPSGQHERSSQSLSRLLDHMEAGLSMLTRAPVHTKNTHDRLAEATLRLHHHAHRLRSVDLLESPTREESVELGREILRKLRHLLGTDKTAIDALDTGKPEDKAAKAEKIEEMVELYKNLLAEVAVANPGIMEDTRIKEANDAVGGFAHAISLMAAKEIPSSVASAQQISAEVTQDPQEWKQLHNRTVDRLLKSMEGGLEAAVQGLEQQEAEKQQDDETSQQAAEATLLNADQTRRRRRRRRQQKSGLSGKASDKKMRDIMADDRAAGQGRFREDTQNQEAKPSAYKGLNATDIAAITALGSSLREAGNQGLGLAMSNATLDAPFKPDNKTAAEVAIDAIKQSRTNRNQPRK